MSAEGDIVIRTHKPADLTWVLQRHREIPLSEFGFNQDFPRMVEHIVAKFVQSFDEKQEHCWIAEMAGKKVGCVFLVRKSDTVAQLRLLLVDTKARRLGIGKRLVDELVRFARHAGYEKIILETNDVAVAARELYSKTGFRLVHSTPRRVFGRDLIDETWEMPL